MGRVFKYGDDVNTDVIIPARYLNSSDPEILKKHCMEDIDPAFASLVMDGDVVVAGENFGCGSSREHAPLALKASGISCVIASSFARIFYRNAINIGLPILECPAVIDTVETGDELEVDTASGKITCRGGEAVLSAEPFPEFIRNIIRCGGLLEYIGREAKE